MPRDKKALSRVLRRRSTYTEKIAWNILRDRRCFGLKFRRQYPILRFVLDFYCLEARLAIEIDGDSHVGREDYDHMRQILIEGEGVTFIRMTVDNLVESPEELVLRIRELITDNTPSPLIPLPEGEGKVKRSLLERGEKHSHRSSMSIVGGKRGKVKQSGHKDSPRQNEPARRKHLASTKTLAHRESEPESS